MSVTKEGKALRGQQILAVSDKNIYIIIIVRFYAGARDSFDSNLPRMALDFRFPARLPTNEERGIFFPREQSGGSDHSCRTCVEIKNVWSPSFTTRNAFTPCIRKPVLKRVLCAFILPIQVAARSKVWVCGCSLAGIAGSNPACGMDICLL
jgi:hypothetical protein